MSNPSIIPIDPLDTNVRVSIDADTLQSEEAFYEEWIAKLKVDISYQRRMCLFCGILYKMIMIPTMILSYLFGITNTHIDAYRGILLVVIGGLTTFINFTKLEKRSQKHKIKRNDFNTLLQDVEKRKIFYKQTAEDFGTFFTNVQKEYLRIVNI
jgi:hypothetical protein